MRRVVWHELEADARNLMQVERVCLSISSVLVSVARTRSRRVFITKKRLVLLGRYAESLRLLRVRATETSVLVSVARTRNRRALRRESACYRCCCCCLRGGALWRELEPDTSCCDGARSKWIFCVKESVWQKMQFSLAPSRVVIS